MTQYIKWFNALSMNDVDLVGGKNASLGEMYQNLTKEGIRIPNGFAVTAEAYKHIFDENNLWESLGELLDNLDPNDVQQLQQTGKECRDIILRSALPKELMKQIDEAYAKLQEEYGEDVSLAVRSSATAEDSPEASFAGQNATYLNIQGTEALLDAYNQTLQTGLFIISIFTGMSISMYI